LLIFGKGRRLAAKKKRLYDATPLPIRTVGQPSSTRGGRGGAEKKIDNNINPDEKRWGHQKKTNINRKRVRIEKRDTTTIGTKGGCLKGGTKEKYNNWTGNVFPQKGAI